MTFLACIMSGTIWSKAYLTKQVLLSFVHGLSVAISSWDPSSAWRPLYVFWVLAPSRPQSGSRRWSQLGGQNQTPGKPRSGDSFTLSYSFYFPLLLLFLLLLLLPRPLSPFYFLSLSIYPPYSIHSLSHSPASVQWLHPLVSWPLSCRSSHWQTRWSLRCIWRSPQ